MIHTLLLLPHLAHPTLETNQHYIYICIFIEGTKKGGLTSRNLASVASATSDQSFDIRSNISSVSSRLIQSPFACSGTFLNTVLACTLALNIVLACTMGKLSIKTTQGTMRLGLNTLGSGSPGGTKQPFTFSRIGSGIGGVMKAGATAVKRRTTLNMLNMKSLQERYECLTVVLSISLFQCLICLVLSILIDLASPSLPLLA
jgi:hypothetical protein